VLSIYRRHRKKCPHAEDRVSRKCRCALWAKGTVEGKPYQKSLKTRNFERAEQLKRKIETGVQPNDERKNISTKDALAAFIKDFEGNGNANPEEVGNEFYGGGGSASALALPYYEDFLNLGNNAGSNILAELYSLNTNGSSSNNIQQVQAAIQTAFNNYIAYLQCSYQMTGNNGQPYGNNSCPSPLYLW
jgi:hypothetical protein